MENNPTPTPTPTSEAKETPKANQTSAMQPWMKAFMVLVGLLILLVIIYAGVKIFHKSPKTSTTTPTSVAQIAKVTVGPKGFTPATLTVSAGTTVEWTSTDVSTTHVVAANPYPSHSDLPGLVSTQLGNGAVYRYTFTTAGTFNYHDDLKPTLNGTIIVK